MIWDDWSRFSQYLGVHPHFATIQSYLARHPLDQLPMGKTNIEGEDCFVVLQEYQTRPAKESLIEAHRTYLDVQLMLDGEERMGLLPLKDGVCGPYEADRDFLELKGEPDFLKFRQGEFMVLYPEDGHMPGVQSLGGAGLARKAVFKVRVKVD